jgi:signal transduction histidine kinase
VHRHRPHPWLRQHPLAADTILAVGLTGAAIIAHWKVPIPDHGSSPSAVGTLLVCLTSLPLALRRRAPIAVLAIVSLAQYAVGLIGYPNASWVSLMVATYTVAAHTNGAKRAIAAKSFAIVTSFVLGWGLVVRKVEIGDFISSVVFLVGAFALGDNLQRRRRNVAELAQRIEHAERERELLADKRAQDERSRIARELHDVVAHSVSLMIIQAGAARRSIGAAPEQAEEALRTLEATGRQAMDELRRVLGVLRASAADTPDIAEKELSPQPSLARVRELVDGDPSLPVELVETGNPPTDLPSSVELSLFRVVQEALTNVRKHAGQVRTVAVKIAYAPDEVVVHIADDGRGASVAMNVDGHGLVGMRERMALCGGTVTAGPRPGGGWQVRAVVPLEPTHRTHVVAALP